MPTRTRSLWTDRPDDWPAAADGEPAPAGPPPAPPRRRSRRRPAAAVALSTLALAGAYVAGTEIGGGSGDRGTAPAATQSLQATGGRLAPTAINTIYAKASRGVVSVQVATGQGRASGTGFVVDRDGTIVTNAHVVSGAQQARVRFDDQAAPIAAEVVGSDPSTDLAVLHVDPARTGALTVLPLAESDDVQVGDAAIAIGYPLGLDRTATAGIVSGLGREIQAPNGFSIDKVIQTDAPINPGNSGGPLLDSKGRVIGVNSQIATAGGGSGNVGIGFAVPSDTVREVVPKLKAGQTIDRPYLGVSTAVATSGRGAAVASVSSGGPADDAGIRQGDVLTAVDGKRIGTPDDVVGALAGRSPGDHVDVRLVRGGAEETVSVTLGSRPGSTP
jgi:putative serine protease PepD